MHDAARGLAFPRLRHALSTRADETPWVPVWSLPAALRALRTTLVAAGLFALADRVIGNLQIATFAAFGGFATLVLASFAGTRSERLRAHAVLALAGSALLSVGTAVNSTPALAALVTVLVAFLVLFAGVAGPNAASGAPGALLAYVLPAASPGQVSMIPDRLAGWWLASAAGTAAALVLWPPMRTDALRGSAVKLAETLAADLEAALAAAATETPLATSIAAKRELRDRFSATPYRPTGLAAAQQAFANTVELLEWCTVLVTDTLHERPDLHGASAPERELLAAASETLRAIGSVLAGGEQRPDIARLADTKARCLAWVRGLQPWADGFEAAARLSFHAHTIAVATLSAAEEALVASRLASPAWLELERARCMRSQASSHAARRVSAIAAAAVRHASVRSVWFINSARGAVALAIAVAVAEVSSVQHGFWVVLGTLSVLRTNASSTGSSAARALAGTLVGFVIGGALLVAIGADSTALWIVLPLAVFAAAYTPGTAPFAVGQAAFTVTIAVLFNLLAPVGWKVGVIRIEDVAIGCAVSVVVGSVVWPRGVAAVVASDLADAFRTGASYLTEAVRWAAGLRREEPDGALAAMTAALRLDDALRGFLSEQGAKHVELHELWRLVGGTLRLRLTARSISELPSDPRALVEARDALADRAGALRDFYEKLAAALVPRRGASGPAPAPPQRGDDGLGAAQTSLYGIWLVESLEHLGEHLAELTAPAARVAAARARPWWR